MTVDPPGLRGQGSRRPDGAGFLDTVRRLGSAQKSGRGPAYVRYVNRRFGRPFAAIAYLLGMSPNSVTAVSGLLTFCGIGLLATATPGTGVGAVVAALLLVGFALDSADGQLARLTGGGSLSGEWLDHVVDAFKVSVLHMAVLLSVHRSGVLDERWLLVPMAFAVVAAAAYFSIQLHDQLDRQVGVGAGSGEDRPLVVSLALLPTDYGVLCMTFVLLGWIQGFIAVYAVLLILQTAHLSMLLGRQYRRLRAIDRQGGSR
jgi:phosphatidylglycerophosphate synthase